MYGTAGRYRLNGPMDDVAANIRERNSEGPDPNPSIKCAECGEYFGWKEYWKPKVTGNGRIENPHEDDWLCDPCHERKVRLERRRENNQKITEWVA